MSVSSAVCRLLLFFLFVNCLQQVRGAIDNDRAAILELAKHDPCNKNEVRDGKPDAVARANAQCMIAFRLFQFLTDHEKAFCKNPGDPKCVLTRGRNGWPRCTFECDTSCRVKVEEKQGTSRRAKTVTVWKQVKERKTQELSFITEPVKKPPKGTRPTDLSGDDAGPSGYGGAGGSGAGGSGAGGSGYKGGYGSDDDDIESGFGRWSIS